MAKKATTKTLSSLTNTPTNAMNDLVDKLIENDSSSRENSYALVARLQLTMYKALTDKSEWHGGQKNSISEDAKKSVDKILQKKHYDFSRTYQAKTWSQMTQQANAHALLTDVPKSTGNGKEKHQAYQCAEIEKLLVSGDIKIVITNPKIEAKKGDGKAGRSNRKWYKFNKKTGQFLKDSNNKPITSSAPKVAIVTDPEKCTTQPAIRKAIEHWEQKEKDAKKALRALRGKQNLRNVSGGN